MHFRTCLLFATLLSPASPAIAQSSFIDLSKPMTGKSEYVFNVDGTPVDLGVPLIRPEPKPEPRASSEASAAPRAVAARAPVAACGGSQPGARSCATQQSRVPVVVVTHADRDRRPARSGFRFGRRR